MAGSEVDRQVQLAAQRQLFALELMQIGIISAEAGIKLFAKATSPQVVAGDSPSTVNFVWLAAVDEANNPWPRR